MDKNTQQPERCQCCRYLVTESEHKGYMRAGHVAIQPVVQGERVAFEKWFRREVGMPDFVDFDQTAPWAEFAFKAWSARAMLSAAQKPKDI